MGDSLEATAVLPDVAQAPVEKVVAYIRYRIYDSMQEPPPLHLMSKTRHHCCGTGTVGTVTFCLLEPEPYKIVTDPQQ
jgi:hypothetical protein